MTTGKLYIVPTPVGNMSDMTPRAVEVLKTCSLIYAEDTRTSGVLLRHFGIDTPRLSFPHLSTPDYPPTALSSRAFSLPKKDVALASSA